MAAKNLVRTFIYKEEIELLALHAFCKTTIIKKINGQ